MARWDAFRGWGRGNGLWTFYSWWKVNLVCLIIGDKMFFLCCFFIMSLFGKMISVLLQSEAEQTQQDESALFNSHTNILLFNQQQHVFPSWLWSRCWKCLLNSKNKFILSSLIYVTQNTRFLWSLWTSERWSARRPGVSVLLARQPADIMSERVSGNTNRLLNQSGLELISGRIARKWSFCPLIKRGWRWRWEIVIDRRSLYLFQPRSSHDAI